MTPDQQEIARLQDIIDRNRECLADLRKTADSWRDRALRAEAALVRRAPKREDPVSPADIFGRLFFGGDE